MSKSATQKQLEGQQRFLDKLRGTQNELKRVPFNRKVLGEQIYLQEPSLADWPFLKGLNESNLTPEDTLKLLMKTVVDGEGNPLLPTPEDAALFAEKIGAYLLGKLMKRVGEISSADFEEVEKNSDIPPASGSALN